MANQGSCSRFEMALKIVEFMRLKYTVNVLPISSEEFILPATRPRSERLENHNLELLNLNKMPRWEDSLKVYIESNL